MDMPLDSESELDESPPDRVRDAQEIARRSLALCAVVGIALGADREDLKNWITDEGLWNDLAPTELAYVSAETPTEKQTIEATWLSERLTVLLWALLKVDLPAPNQQADTALFLDLVPPFSNDSVSEFLRTALRRSENELLEMAEELLQSHWRARDAQLHSKPMPADINIEIIQERHHAINWVIGYEGLAWDEVTTDT
jgi:hypothetical protein